jgi:hypothetical protein
MNKSLKFILNSIYKILLRFVKDYDADDYDYQRPCRTIS